MDAFVRHRLGCRVSILLPVPSYLLEVEHTLESTPSRVRDVRATSVSRRLSVSALRHFIINSHARRAMHAWVGGKAITASLAQS
jgi:hypothetical protein